MCGGQPASIPRGDCLSPQDRAWGRFPARSPPSRAKAAHQERLFQETLTLCSNSSARPKRMPEKCLKPQYYPHPFCSSRPGLGERNGISALLLPAWAQGLGDEGNASTSQTSSRTASASAAAGSPPAPPTQKPAAPASTPPGSPIRRAPALPRWQRTSQDANTDSESAQWHS